MKKNGAIKQYLNLISTLAQVFIKNDKTIFLERFYFLLLF